MPHAEVGRIEFFSIWVGFADPPSRVGKLVISKDGDRYERKVFPEGPVDEVPSDIIDDLLKALSRPLVSQLEARLFSVPERVVERHYGSCWTDDGPGLLARVTFKNGQKITIETHSQHAYMLPLMIRDPVAQSSGQTFDPVLSEALGRLMPDHFQGKERLSGAMLELEVEEFQRFVALSDTLPATEEPIPEETESSAQIDFDDLIRGLCGEETPEEKAAAKESGQWSKRLLKKIPFEEMQECFENGANPNYADDVGQTALMYAAWPPFEPRRFRLLVKAGADVNACRNDGLNGLQIACLGGEFLAATEWVKAGADIHARAPEGATPLMLAARWTQIVQMLLQAGAEVNAVDADGHSALVYAIARPIRWEKTDSSKTVQALVDAGADVNCRDRQGVTPLGHARRVLADLMLQEEVFRAFYPERAFCYERDIEEQQLVEEVVRLIESAGGTV